MRADIVPNAVRSRRREVEFTPVRVGREGKSVVMFVFIVFQWDWNES